jgi:mono/diheme cytochrome c family protein
MKVVIFIVFAVTLESSILWSQSAFRPRIPKTWDEAALADWATPIAGLNVRPTHISAKEYYSLAVENRRTFPVYYPGREPEAYWEMLQHIAPKPLIEPEQLKSEGDWIEAGRRVFYEADNLHLRTLDPRVITAARSRETFEKVHAQPLADGTVFGLRWVPTKDGVALSLSNCAGCHLLYLPDNTPVAGAPALADMARGRDSVHLIPLIGALHTANRVVTGATPFFMGPESLGVWLYQAYGVPWRKDDIHEQLKAVTPAQYSELVVAATLGGGVARWNGSLYYPAKVPDLIGIKERKYIDATATHAHRDVGDLMRYAALVSFAETADFGPYHVLGQDTKRVQMRLPDEALYALALFIYSLQPPPNPTPLEDKARVGQKIFVREGCPTCHTPPLYTSNKLTLALSFTPPNDKPASLDVLPISVGTDSSLALATRKGTGYYKVPSLKGVWYRGHYLHDGSVASLEEMFDPDRLKTTHTPGGWMPPGAKTHAIQGHEFGLKLRPEEREQLLVFLRTL